MNEKTEPRIGYGVTGWKARQENSRRRLSRNSDERAKIRAIRKKHKQEIAARDAQPASAEPQAIVKQAEVKQPEVEIIAHKGGWFEVQADGVMLTDKKVRKAEAEAIAEKYRNG
jgi:ribosomal protein S20